jgi:hypothetical protein
MAKQRSQSASRSVSSAWASAFRDIFVASINKGQFPFAILGLIAMSLIWRMPPQDVSKLVFRILGAVERGALLGYLLAFFAIAGWCIHAKYQRRVISAELDRVAAQRNELQTKNLGAQRIKSSRVK